MGAIERARASAKSLSASFGRGQGSQCTGLAAKPLAALVNCVSGQVW